MVLPGLAYRGTFLVGAIMKIITSSQVLAISGGCQRAVDKYETSASFYDFVGTVTGLAIGASLTATYSTPVQILSSLAGSYIGSEVGYAFGAVSYWVDRAIHKTTDSFLKPSL